MKKVISNHVPENVIYNFVKTGFQDYLSARLLINTGLFMPGITLASSAVEKYLKAILWNKTEVKKVHLDNISEIQNTFKKLKINLMENFDDNFLKILSVAYKIRYYDNVKGELSFGFFINQVLAELDYTIDYLDSSIKIIGKTDGNDISPYKEAIRNKDEILFKNNYLLNKIEKKVFMERPSKVCNLYIDKEGRAFDLHLENLKIKKYEGKIARLLKIELGWGENSTN